MLKDFGATYVILGHSERSTAYCESAENVAAKFVTAKNAGLTPILCVGETLQEREAGVMEHVVSEQLDPILALHGAGIFKNAVISYEPIWAIGTGLTASAEQAQEMHAHLRVHIAAKYGATVADNCSILYGGSCNAKNAQEIFAGPDVDGGLIGGASLIAADFITIAKSF